MPITATFGGMSTRNYGFQSGVLVGDFDSIATTTVGVGGVTDLTFSSIPQTYTHLQLRILVREKGSGAGPGSIDFQFNGDTATNYGRHLFSGDGATPSSSSGVTINFIRAAGACLNTNAANVFGVCVVDILDYTNVNKYKTTRSIAGVDNNGNGEAAVRTGHWRSTSAITSIRFFSPAATTPGFSQYSSFALYGIKA